MASKKMTVKFPLVKSGKNIGFETLTEEELTEVVKFNIKNIILTNPGEKTWDSDFGAGAMGFLFEQATQSLLLDLRTRIVTQLRLYAPYVNLLKLNVSYNDEHTLLISMKYEITINEVIDTMEIEITDNLI